MKSKAEYALLAAMDLAVHYAADRPVKVQDIARRTGAPAKYLGQLLLRLKARALVRSAQGPSGGYWLMRRPALISAAEILEAIATARDGRHRQALPKGAYRDVLKALASRMEDAQRRLLSNITLADLAEQTGRAPQQERHA